VRVKSRETICPRCVVFVFRPIFFHVDFCRPKKQSFYFRIATPSANTRAGENSPLQELEYPNRSLVTSASEFRHDLTEKFLVTNSGMRNMGGRIWGRVFNRVKLTKDLLYGKDRENENGMLLNALRRMNI